SSSAERGCAKRPHIWSEPPPKRYAGLGLGSGALLAHGDRRNRRLRGAGGTRQGAPADSLLGVALQVHLGELPVREAPGHVASVVGGRCHLNPGQGAAWAADRGTVLCLKTRFCTSGPSPRLICPCNTRAHGRRCGPQGRPDHAWAAVRGIRPVREYGGSTMQDTTKQTPYGTPTDTSPDDEQKHDMPETGPTETPYTSP